ncbi:trypsin-like peptidase domain-containing protein [Alicyclobacillus fastidiosus]|uniref:Trypsin-like peptidase domain-containing protein n=1 Tax=Alicyclobacillus fastidiosus TaxID=392011 RepID=A0ABY6ZFH0_9BACL|nr:trypsin-like peptidase domain-containing protein [Alicyclobacillus fastidiosus]WAH40865.1 trypsin-like peptidase domain-containing protein [Alicyclobacillus fastidiosus]GMA62353.1 2-alkenal reductase [Alicyclobacillus fastidiosus]
MGRRWDDFDDWPKERRKGRKTAIMWPSIGLGLAVFYVLGIWTGAGIAHPRGSNVVYLPSQTPSSSGTQSRGDGSGTSIPSSSGTTLVTDIYNETKNSIFTITAVNSSGSQSSGAQEDIGTGFLIDTHGDVATNAHVVGSAKTVQLSVGNQTFKGTVLDADTLDDLAIVHINAPSSMRPLPLGSVKSLQPGNLVVAIGNPFELTASVSSGIVSGLNRSMSESSGHVMNGMIQTDAPLNPGNSGGPLLNANGQVVGINTLIESPIEGSIGIGFAIPIDRLVSLEQKLIAGQPIEHAWLGIEGMDVDSLMQQEMNLSSSTGVYVTSVTKNSPAAKAGLRGDTNAAKLNSASDSADPFKILKGDGDIIVGIDGKTVTTIEQLTQYIDQDEPGQTVTLSVIRGGRTQDVKVTLAPWPGQD